MPAPCAAWGATRSPLSVQFFDRNLVVGVDTDLPGDAEGLFRNIASRKLCVLKESARRRQSILSATADGDNALIRFNDVAGTADQECLLQIGDYEQSFEIPQHLVSPPILGKFHRGSAQV